MSQNDTKISSILNLKVIRLIVGLYLFFILLFFASVSLGAIPRKQISEKLIADFYAVKSQQVAFDAKDIIPLDLKPTNNQNQVLTQIADQGINSWMASDTFKKSVLGRTTTQVQETMQTNVVIGGNQDSNSNEIQHRFNFNMQVFQNLAQMKYTGITTLTVNYHPFDQKTDLAISEKISGSQDLVFNHINSNEDQLSKVSLHWSF